MDEIQHVGTVKIKTDLDISQVIKLTNEIEKAASAAERLAEALGQIEAVFVK